MNTANLADIYELSPLQQGLLFHTIYAPNSGIYFEQFCWTLEGDFNVAAFKLAWEKVVERHPILRTAFYWQDLEKPYQVVYQQVELPWDFHDWQEFSAEVQKQKLEAFLQADRQRGFELSQAPLIRLNLFRLDDNTYEFVWSSHHILLDGWSESLVFKEVYAFYQGFCQGEDVKLNSPRPYRDYINWLQQQDLSKAEAFWRKTLKGFDKPTTLLLDKNPGILPSLDEDYDWQRIELSKATTTALQSLGKQHQLTLNTLVQGAWTILLSRYSGEFDIVFGSTSSGRPPNLPGVENMVGLFVNTLPLRVQVTEDALLLPWLKELQNHQIEVIQYEYSPLVEVQRWSDVNRGLSLFEIGYVLENYPVDAALAQGIDGLKIQSGQFFEKTDHALTLIVVSDAALTLKLLYDTRRFDQQAIARMLGHLQTLLTGMVTNPTARLSELSLLSQTEQHQLLVEFNKTKADYPQDKCLHQLFEEQAIRTPDNIAVIFDGDSLTYKQLNERANQLANYLQKLGVVSEVLVGICVERSLEMLIGILGILKAGGAYVPLDPSYPQERLAFMLNDTQAPILLTTKNLLGDLPETTANIICLDTDWENINNYSSENPLSSVKENNLAYVIYTSGSTGKPKGVQIAHGSVVNFLESMRQQPGLTEFDTLLAVTSISFDIAALELYLPLICGARLVIVSREIAMDGEKLSQNIAATGATVMQATPATWRMLLTSGWVGSKQLKILCGGEALTCDLAANLLTKGAELWNLYGPTETTIWSTVSQVETSKLSMSLVPIGRPIANTQIYILDQQLQPVPIGVPGELHIGGAGLSRGYLNRPELTTEKFVLNPFKNGKSPHLYKTGDLARYLPDGTIECLGRIDHQVKIRGFRIELGEIEANLNQHPGVEVNAVIAKGDTLGEKRLVAYVVQNPQYQGDSTKIENQQVSQWQLERSPSNSKTELRTITNNIAPIPERPLHSYANNPLQAKVTRELIPQLRQYLQSKLPEYMVPSAFVLLDTLPLTPNGKLDRKALPEPDLGRSEPETKDAVALTPIQEILTGIWSQVLGVSYIGINDNFFDLGGHSLLATQVISRVRETFQIELPLRCLFESPTIGKLSASIEAEIKTQQNLQVPPLVPVSIDGEIPLSFAQERFWLMSQITSNNALYNNTVTLKISGKLNISALEQSINEIVRRHETLRTTFPIVQGKPKIAISPTLNVNLAILDLRELDPQTRHERASQIAKQEAKQPFDLAQSPLLRTTLLWLDSTEYILLLNLHHIISDGWSMGVWIEEITALYPAYCEGKTSPLPELAIQYGDFAVWQRQWLQGEELQKQLNYWKQQLGSDLPPLKLPIDKPRPQQSSQQGKKIDFSLPLDLSKQLQQLSQQEGVTLFMTLLAAFKTLLYCYSGQTDIRVGSPIANRDRQEIEKLIGLFINTLVLRTDLSNNPNFRELLGRIREVTLGAYTHQNLPFEKIAEELQPDRNQTNLPLFQVWFVLQNAPLGSLELPNLTLQPLDIHNDTTGYDLGLFLDETPTGISGCFEYSTDLFFADTITQMADNFQTLLTEIVNTPDLTLNEIAAKFNETQKAQKTNKAKELESTNLKMLKNIKRQSFSRS
ncbi:non-ribosomal peptide synthetase [Anabaena sp. 4-3]|uniref:non-ribosomal peptide synthetase n=1 Tax=Anabaena sp. 4-3 TaxID=1811979 RepID=UPI0008363663|nr:non-ribosomal peptide synthetase [Anabaena sp. 4-3]